MTLHINFSDCWHFHLSIHDIDVSSLLSNPDHPSWPRIHALMDNGIKAGVVKPLNLKVFPLDDIQNALAHWKEKQEEVAIEVMHISALIRKDMILHIQKYHSWQFQ